MSLFLSPQAIGEPHWEQMNPGDASTWSTQYLDVKTSPKRWRTIPWVNKSYPCRIDVNWRRPVTKKGKIEAAWAALPKLLAYYILRRK